MKQKRPSQSKSNFYCVHLWLHITKDMSNDHPVQIIQQNSNTKQFTLNRPALQLILAADDVYNANIAVISIAGAFRKGKSFMLSFFLRYLNAKYVENRDDWLGDESSSLSGFAWRGGYRRHTTGIWVWSKVFTKVLPNGEKIGIMLMDTQGTFDSSSTMNDNVTIFSLSTMLSSVQIFNLFNNIQEDNLQHLQLFTEYGKLAKEQSNEKAFQMLLFLVRDWSYPYEAEYGFNGGRIILDKALEIRDDHEEELKYVRRHIKSCYEKLDCFLMPYPGRLATVSKDFVGKLSEIDVEFKDMLKVLVPALLAPENVVIKKVNGAKVTGFNLLVYFEKYWTIFESGERPTAKTIFQATVEANNLSAKQEAEEHYYSRMDAETDSAVPFIEFNALFNIHNRIQQEALSLFRAKAVLGDESLRHEYYSKLVTNLQKELASYVGVNEAKRTKNLEQIISNLNGQIAQFRATTEQQTQQMAALHRQIDEYRQSSEGEKEMLRAEILLMEEVPKRIGNLRFRGGSRTGSSFRLEWSGK